MNSITSEAHFHQRVIRYSEKDGVTVAGNRFHRSRQAIYEWKARYDGNRKSLMDKSHRPHSHPTRHTEQEDKLIEWYYHRNKGDGTGKCKIRAEILHFKQNPRQLNLHHIF